MTRSAPNARIDVASRLVRAPAARIYRALLDPHALLQWLPPEGMSAHLHAFDARVGGGYRMTLNYVDANHGTPGKTSPHSDTVRVSFIDLVPGRRVVQEVQFESDDDAFAGVMTMTWLLTATAGGTEVSVRCENVPHAIRPEDHAAGLRASLANLAAHTE